MDVILLADDPALDFVGTISERTTSHIDQLAKPDDLDTWLVAAGVLDTSAHSTPTDLVHAKRVREAIYAVLRASTAGGAPPRTALRTLNAAAAEPPPTVQMTSSGRLRQTGTTAAALSALSRAAIALLTGDDLERVKWCADDRCTHPFLDRSRGARRRWCGMSGCGDRAKARAYRARQRGDD